jgi:TnpA family transposase
VLEQATELKPVEIMTDTGAYIDAIFGIFYLLGFQSARGSLTPAARASGGSIPRPITAPSILFNTKLIAEQWDDLLRLGDCSSATAD